MILKIFSPKNSAKKIGVFYSKQSLILKKFYHNIGFWEKRQFLRLKLQKIVIITSTPGLRCSPIK
jgi:hypothetical protein